jgi:Holliday junction resolvase RusA-like endonuclease
MRYQLKFVVNGAPAGAERHRVGQGRRMYHTSKHVTEQERIALVARAAGVRALPEGPVYLRLTAWFARPQKRLRRVMDRGVPAYYRGKPDADNLAKLYMDALTYAGAWPDDTQVAMLRVVRRYLDLDLMGTDIGRERVEVYLSTLDGP